MRYISNPNIVENKIQVRKILDALRKSLEESMKHNLFTGEMVYDFEVVCGKNHNPNSVENGDARSQS